MTDNSTVETHEDPQTEDTLQQDGEPETVAEDPKAKRYLEQLKGREAQVQKLEGMLIKTATAQVEADNGYLEKIYKEDPALADKVAKEFGVGSAKEAIAKIKEARGEPAPSVDKEDIFREWEERQAQKNALAAAKKHFDGLSPDERKTAETRFNKLIEGKKLSSEELEEVAEMAVMYYQKGDAKDQAIAKLSSTPLGRKQGHSKSKDGPGKSLAESMGLLDLYK